jgi:hypothetical protein
MSFHTALQIANHGDASLDFDGISGRVLALLDRDGIHHDLLSDLRESFSTGNSICYVDPLYLLQLLEDVAIIAPHFHFEVRCLGEEFRHTWIREFSQGKSIFEAGPWDYE